MIYHLAAETSASKEGGINLTTSGCGIYLDAPKHVCRNVDDDQNPDAEPPESGHYELWDIDHDPSEGENDLRMLTIIGSAGPDGGTMTLEVFDGTDGGKVKLWKDPLKEDPADQLSWEVDPYTSRPEYVYVEGFEVGKVKFKATMTCYLSGSKTTTATTKVYEVDIDIDSENKSPTLFDKNIPRDKGTDQLEASDKDGRTGKIYPSFANKDNDEDNVPDWADGFGVAGRLLGKSNFLPLVLEVRKPYEVDKCTITFIYDMSDPRSIEKPGANELWPSLATSGFRLWKADAGTTRSLVTKEKGGFIPAGEKLQLKDVVASNSATTLFLEFVTKEDLEFQGKKTISVIIQKDEEDESSDSFHVYALPLLIDADIDSDNNNYVRAPAPSRMWNDTMPDESSQEDAIEAVDPRSSVVSGKFMRPSGILPKMDNANKPIWQSTRPLTPLVIKISDKSEFITEEKFEITASVGATVSLPQNYDQDRNKTWLRMWKKDGEQLRNPTTAPSGDFIAAKEYKPEDLDLEDERRKVIYLEGASPKISEQATTLTFKYRCKIFNTVVEGADKVRIRLRKPLDRLRYRVGFDVDFDGGRTSYSPFVITANNTLPPQSTRPTLGLDKIKPFGTLRPRDNIFNAFSGQKLVGYLPAQAGLNAQNSVMGSDGKRVPIQANGYFISTTGYFDRSKREIDPERYVDADTVNYLVGKSGFGSKGDVAIVLDCSKGNDSAKHVAVIGDSGNRDGDEASYAMNQALGNINVDNAYKYENWRPRYLPLTKEPRFAVHVFRNSASDSTFSGRSNTHIETILGYLLDDEIDRENYAEECQDYSSNKSPATYTKNKYQPKP